MSAEHFCTKKRRTITVTYRGNTQLRTTHELAQPPDQVQPFHKAVSIHRHRRMRPSNN
jgi:hypothetical protein